MTAAEDQEWEELVMEAGIMAGGFVVNCLQEKQPCRTSLLGGQEYIDEILDTAHPGRVLEVCRMPHHVFLRVCEIIRTKDLLTDTAAVSIEQQMIIFLFIVGSNASNRSAQSRFQHSGETISKYFNAVLEALMALYPKYVKLPNESSDIPIEILTNPKFYPYFKDCVGAIDGTHIHANIPSDEQVNYRNRKKFISQNVLAACSFDLLFQYVLAGWEGSAADARVIHDAVAEKNFRVPPGKYFLADAGYGHTINFLVPYRGIRYHLREWAQSNQRPQTPKELFNLRHSSLRNSIERIFGVVKNDSRYLRRRTITPSRLKFVWWWQSAAFIILSGWRRTGSTTSLIGRRPRN